MKLMATQPSGGVSFKQIVADCYYCSILSFLGYRVLKPAGKTGPLDVTVRVVGYKPHVLRMLNLIAQPSLIRASSRISTDEEEEFNDKLTSTIDLILVDDVKIESAGESLYNHPKNKVFLFFFFHQFSL